MKRNFHNSELKLTNSNAGYSEIADEQAEKNAIRFGESLEIYRSTRIGETFTLAQPHVIVSKFAHP